MRVCVWGRVSGSGGEIAGRTANWTWLWPGGRKNGARESTSSHTSAFLTTSLLQTFEVQTLPRPAHAHKHTRAQVAARHKRARGVATLFFARSPGWVQLPPKRRKPRREWLGAGIRALSDTVLSSGRQKKMTHRLSLEPGVHKHISIPLNSAPRMKAFWQFMNNQTACHVCCKLAPRRIHTHAHTQAHSIWHNFLYP